MRICSTRDQLAWSSQHKICQSQAGCRTIELELVSADVGSEVALPAVSQAEAERQLMVSAKQTDIVVHAVHRPDIPMARNKPAGQIKTANDGVHNRPSNFRGAVDVDAGIAPIEKLARLDVGITISSAIHRQTKRLNQVSAHQIGRTKCVRTRQATSVTSVLKEARIVVPGIRYNGACQKNPSEQGMLGT